MLFVVNNPATVSPMRKKPSEQIPFNPARWPFFYGWLILFWGVIGIILSVPGQTTGVSAFIEPLIESLGISRLQISGAYMIGTLTSALFLTPAGKLFDRIGARVMGFGSCVALSLVLFLLSCSDHITTFVARLLPEQIAAITVLSVLFFFLRLSGQGILTMASRNMIMKWFDRHRGLASGISGAAVAFGFSYAPTLFSKLIKIYGWSGTWLLLSLALLLVFSPLVLLFFRDNPEACGLVPDGKTVATKSRKKPEVTRQFTLPEARRTFPFWAFTFTMSMQALIITAVTFNIESIFEGAGMTGAQGLAVFPPAAQISVVVTLLGGWLCDRVELRWFLVITLFSMALNLAGMLFLRPGWPMHCIIVGNGIANGLFAVLMSVTWPRYFGRQHLGAVSGLCMTLMVVFSAIGPAFFSGIQNLTGAYTLSYLICLFATLVLLAGSFFAYNPQK